ncbi:acyl-CoA dehydrogenase family protein [Enemella sp. A6]|uniref:acyl-CoA dehydrogenase family protein n=1 Tax=Enemella sp. A6 TaxID=3440152 RepID=UPI003EB94C77
MDFKLDEELHELRSLAAEIFTDRAGVDRVTEVERTHGGFDADLWQTLAEAGMVGIGVPEEHDGSGFGMLGLVTLLEQQGRRVAPVPLWAVSTLAAQPIAGFGTDEQQARWLPGLLDGSLLVTGAFESAPGTLAAVRAEPAGSGWRFTGEALGVPALSVADAVVVPAVTDDGRVLVAILPTDRDGVRCTGTEVTGWGSSGILKLAEATVDEADLLVGDGAEIRNWILRRARVALAGVQVGVCAEALAQTAEYTSMREQFGRPLSTNQAVALRAADGYLDTENTRLTTWRAAWLLDQGREAEAESAALVAKLWASEAGLRVVHTTQHLHGGIGADIDYPIHRYFLWGRQVAFTLGSAAATASALGDVLPEAPPIGAPA